MRIEEEQNGVHDENHDEDGQLAPHNVVDKVVFGRRLRAARILHGFDRVTEFTNILRSRYGVDVTDRSVYAIERGEQMPHLDFFVAALALLNPDRGYFFPSIRGDVVEALKKYEHI